MMSRQQGLDVIVREEFYKLIIDEQQENGRTFIISTHIIEEAANVFEEVIILKDKCVYLKENTVELLDKCRYVSGLEEDVKNAVDGCKIINEEHIGRSYAVTVMQDGDGKIKAVQHSYGTAGFTSEFIYCDMWTVEYVRRGDL